MMKVLLLHEFSGVHTELRAALRRRGVAADIATFGDYHKGFGSDYRLGPVGGGVTGAVMRVAMQIRNLANYRKYDIIQSISPSPFNKLITRLVEPLTIGGRSRPKYVYLSAGGDVFYRRQVKQLAYYPAPESIDVTAPESLETRIAAQADAMISCTWEYHYTLEQSGYRSTFIPLPVDTSTIDCRSIPLDGKLTVYHPLNRKEGNDFKGTSHIRAAFRQLSGEMYDQVNFVELGNMSITEYHKFMSRVDVVVDQTNSYAYGMSGLYALARGQVLLGGNEPVTHQFDVYRRSPVINILPDADQIASTLRALVGDRQELARLGRRGHEHARTYHEADEIADRYIALYKDVLAEGGR